MKKLLVLFTLVFSLGLVGCSPKEEVVNVSMDDIKSAVLSDGVLAEKPMESDAKEHWIFETVQDSIEEGFVLQAMINVRLQDVIVVKTTDVEKVKEALENYKTNNLRMFEDGYGGEDNIIAAKESILNNVGDYVYFIATPNSKDVEAKILEVLK